MRSSQLVRALYFSSIIAGTSFASVSSNSASSFDLSFKALLSPNATISFNASTAPRWSEFNAPDPGLIVNVITESDVQVIVQYAIKRKIPFLAQNGGHGWISTLNLHKNGILINLSGLSAVSFNNDRTEVTIQGGAQVKQVVDAAYSNNAQVVTGNCNCIGALGAGLGGGYGNLLGLHGFSVDNIISLNVVVANGSLVTVTAADKDLFWALRGAGPNFGIVTSVVMKSFPVPQAKSTAWLGALFFTGDQVEAISEAIEKITLSPKMNIFQSYLTTGAPSFTPVILVRPFYLGSAAEGKAAFASIYAIGPFNDTTAERPYNEWNAGTDFLCIEGERKPSYGAGILQMAPSTWRSIWSEFVAFLKNPGTGSTVIVLEAYSLQLAQSIPASSASFANRHIRFNAAAVVWYSNSTLDPIAESFGSKVRDLWRSTSMLPENRTYINFAHGDEVNEVVYFDSTSRLRELKKRYDPENAFNHWFDL